MIILTPEEIKEIKMKALMPEEVEIDKDEIIRSLENDVQYLDMELIKYKRLYNELKAKYKQLQINFNLLIKKI